MNRRVIDAVFVVIVLSAAYLVGVWTVEDAAGAGKQPMFYQSSFAPAVMLACGHGYYNVDLSKAPEFTAFLLVQRDRFECADLPPNLTRREFDAFEGISRYFESVVALVWRVRGDISWSALLPLFGVMVAAAALATYGLLRVVGSPIVALAGTFLTAFSPMALSNLVNLRDYAKAPFLLGLLWIMALVLRRPRSTRVLFALAAAAAVLEGVGLGFRTDLWLVLPLIALVFATARVERGSAGRVRAVAAIVFVGFSVSAAWPIISAGYARASNTAHVVLLGFSSPFDAALRVAPANYTLGSLYNDDYLHARVAAFAEVLGVANPPAIGTPEYDRVSDEYLRQTIRMFPGDVATRAVAAFVGVLESPFSAHSSELAYARAPLRRVFAIRDRVVTRGAPLFAAIIAGIVVGAVVVEPWPSVVAILVFVVLSSAAMLQFHPRHFFYVEVLIWLPLLAAADNVSMLRHLNRRRIRREGVIAAVILFIGGPIGVSVAVYVARSIQLRQTEQWFAQLRSAERNQLIIRTESTGEGQVRFALPALRNDPENPEVAEHHPVSAGRYAIVLGGASCDRLNVPLIFRYSSSIPFDDFTEEEAVPLPLDGGEVTLYRSVFDVAYHNRFSGIETDAGSGRCIERIEAIPERAWPQALTSVTDAPGASWHERLAWERSRDRPRHVVTLPADISRRAVVKALSAPLHDPLSFKATVVHVNGASLRVDGSVDGPFTYLASLADHRAAPDDMAIVTGDLGYGGVTIGLQQHGTWSRSVNITNPGPFVVAIRPSAAGEYQLVVANCLLNGSTKNDASIVSMGWTLR